MISKVFIKTNIFHKFIFFLSFSFFSLFSWHSFSVFSVVDTGKLLRFKRFEISAHTQALIEEDKWYLNLITQLDEPFFDRKDMNIRYLLSLGEYGLSGAGFLKWVPFPDYQYQPAIGAIIGLSYRYSFENDHFFGVHLKPLFSKEFETFLGEWTPYIAFPVGILIKNFILAQYPLRWALGLRTELSFIHFRKIEFNLEFSMDFRDFTGAEKSTPLALIIGASAQFK